MIRRPPRSTLFPYPTLSRSEAQQPQWAHLPIRHVSSTGTDNAMYRLGNDMVVRLPLRPSSIAPADKEHRWVPVLAPDRKSTRLNSSHSQISYAVFCLKKKIT